jgi:hypothetical protein
MQLRRIHVLLSTPMLCALAAACSSGSSSPGTPNGSLQDGGGGSDGSGNNGDDQSDDGGQTSTTDFEAVLSGAQVVPATQSKASGTARLSLQDDGVTLKYDITQNAASATAVNLHVGAPGESGGVIHPLTPVSAHMTGTITLAEGEPDELSTGMLYIDVQTTSAFPAGELRGQVVSPGSEIFVAAAEGSQEIPEITSDLQAHASFIVNANKDTARYHFATTGSPVDVRVQRAIGGLVGPVAYPLSPVGTAIDGSLTLSANDAADIEGGHWYLNVVTSAYPAGEIRGQVLQPGEKLYTCVLSGTNEVPPVPSTASGGAQFVLSPASDNLRYEVDVSGIIPTGAELGRGTSGTNGARLYSLVLGQGGALGSTPVTANDVQQLDAGNVYVNVRTASYTNGELRCQLTRR